MKLTVEEGCVVLWPPDGLRWCAVSVAIKDDVLRLTCRPYVRACEPLDARWVTERDPMLGVVGVVGRASFRDYLVEHGVKEIELLKEGDEWIGTIR